MKIPSYETVAAVSSVKGSLRNSDIYHSEAKEQGEYLDAVLPREKDLPSLLGIDECASLEEILRVALLNPVKKVTSNPGKKVRGRLVTLGYRLFSDGSPRSVVAAKQCRVSAEVIEFIHAGSLVVDDIEDGSRVRRGRPALHIQYGMPVALNAGNWLYFWPFELLKNLDLPNDRILLMYEHYHRTLLRAHFGQAMDLGMRVDTLPQHQVTETCLASMQLKTGALMGFAVVLGGVIAEVSEPVLRILEKFGSNLGVALQMFDDLGNLSPHCEPSKRYEDLILYRPSWAWACAATHFTASEYRKFTTAVGKLPDTRDLERWLVENSLMELGRSAARRRLNLAFRNLEEEMKDERIPWSKRALDELYALGEEIAFAYE